MSSAIDPGKMITPYLCAGIEKGDKLTSAWIDRISFDAFKFVTAVTGGNQITAIVASTSRSWQDVFHNQGRACQPERSFAIFAAMICRLNDLPRQIV
jgi:hypothetical protein